jgi:hypothetical protein
MTLLLVAVCWLLVSLLAAPIVGGAIAGGRRR